MLPRPLPRASAVWVAIIGGAVLVDWWADRGEADGDSVSECFRALVERIPGGRVLFAGSCVAVPWWFYNHIASGFDGSIEPKGDPRDATTSGGLTTT